MESLKAENERLQEENSKLAQDLRELEVIKAENETMKEYLGLTEKYANYQAIPAYIISKDISNYSKIFVINVGKKDGIEENMTVIADQGLIRLCSICNRYYCKGANNNRFSKLSNSKINKCRRQHNL